MIVLYPALLLGAAAIVTVRQHAAGRGRAWFAAWAGAGYLFWFSFVTGLSIGLLLLPAAAAALLAVAWLSPHLVEASGFLLGGGLLVLTVVVL